MNHDAGVEMAEASDNWWRERNTHETKSTRIGVFPDVLHQSPAGHPHRDTLERSGSSNQEGGNVSIQRLPGKGSVGLVSNRGQRV